MALKNEQSCLPVGNDVEVEGTSGSVKVNGVELYYELYGNGPHPVLCIPGALGGTIFFVPQINYFGRSGSGYTFVAYDPRGYGRSKQNSREFTSPLYYEIDAQDAVLLMKAVGFETFSLLGWCDGATCALIAAAKFPDVVKSIVIWGARSYLDKTDVSLFEKYGSVNNWEPKIRATAEKYYGDELGVLWKKWFDGFIGIYSDPLRQGDICKKEVKMVQCPALIVHGDEDPVLPLYQVQFLQNNLLNVRCEIIPGGRHSLHWKFSSTFNSIVDKFLNHC